MYKSSFTGFLFSMVNYCVAFGCRNTCKDGVSVFRFPKESNLRKKWIEQVKRTRAYWSGPTGNSVLCSAHFTSDCFEPSQSAYGIKKRIALTKDAIPTIFKRPAESVGAGRHTPRTKRAACGKLNRSRVRSNISHVAL